MPTKTRFAHNSFTMEVEGITRAESDPNNVHFVPTECQISILSLGFEGHTGKTGK